MTSTTWPRNNWYMAAYAHEVDQGPVARTIAGERVVVFRSATGAAAALIDRCPHRLVPLSLGRLIDGALECRYHGMTFNGDGICVAIPGQDVIPHRIRTYPIVEQQRLVWLWTGDPERADPSLIPDVFWMTDPAWTCVSDYHYIKADYRLLVDNFLDPSHESFLHQESIGNRAVAESAATAQIVDNREVRVHRFMADCEPPPFFVAANGLNVDRIDRWHTSIYKPPSHCVVETGAVPAGVTDRRQATERRIITFMTPETATTVHFFITVARGYKLDDEEISNYIFKATQATVEQDRMMLEAQQRAMDENPGVEIPEIAMKVDAGPVFGRRLLKTLLEHDRQSARNDGRVNAVR